ncbi:MAG: hypothetical protein P8X42_14560 [Calditrichaceae bacterium]|jgi:hypothetical protein
MSNKKGQTMEAEPEQTSLQDQKIELIRLRIKNKYYDRDDIIRKVIQEIYERDVKKDTLN